MMTIKLTIKKTSSRVEVMSFTKPAIECGMIVAKAHEMFGTENVLIEYL